MLVLYTHAVHLQIAIAFSYVQHVFISYNMRDKYYVGHARLFISVILDWP